MTMSRRMKILIVFIAVLIIGYSFTLLSQSSNQVPQSFTDARTQGAAIAENIVNISNQSTAELQQIDQLDEQGNYTQALTLTTSLIAQSQQLRDQAVQLSNQVENMTTSLSGVNSDAARQAAFEAIASRLAVINQLITYSNDLENLLTTLQNHFTGKSMQPHDVQTLVNQINTDVTAINNFNQQSNQAMSQFDAIMAKQ